MRDLHKEFVHRKIKKPNPILAGIIQFVFKIISKSKGVEFVYGEGFEELRNQQVLVLAQHQSKLDYIYVTAGLKRTDVHILCGYQNIFQRFVYPLFKRLGVISKMLYQPDTRSVVQIMRAKKLGDSVLIFPEGIQSTSGSNHPINPATVDLIRKLGLPVILVTTFGSYMSRTRYSADVKKGKIVVTYSKLFDTEDYEKYTNGQLNDILLEKFRYNEFEENRKRKVAFIGKKPNIYGLDNIIYRCPCCNEEFKLGIEGDTISCSSCRFSAYMDEYYEIHAKSGVLPFSDIDEWYKWQRFVLRDEVKSPDFVMQTRAKLGQIDTRRLRKNYSIVYKGEGSLTLNSEGLTYRGTLDGEDVCILFEAKDVYSLTMSLEYELDLYYNNKYYSFKLTENEKTVSKWMLAAEEIHLLYDENWKNASYVAYGNGASTPHFNQKD